MAETIETFVEKLKSEGLEEGQRQADQIRREAQNQAESILQQAQEEAEKITSEANAQAQQSLARSKTEMQLAARDAAMKLREALQRALQELLISPMQQQLNEPEFLKSLIQQIAMKYAEEDVKGVSCIKINLTPEMHKQLTNWAIEKLRPISREHGDSLDIKNTLRQAGFELNITGATVEITQDSVIAILMEMVGPTLREVFDKAFAGQGAKSSDN